MTLPEIIFSNVDFLVVDKPTGWLSVYSRLGEKETRPVVGVHLEKTEGQLFPCHRLDFEVKGLLLFAKNANSHKISQKWFGDHLVQKTYLARTHLCGEDQWPQQIERRLHKVTLNSGENILWKSTMSRGKKRAYMDAKGLKTQTQACFLQSETLDQKKFLQWKLNPITGRSHQLRLEMAYRGFVIKGDELYGSTFSQVGIDLQAWELDFQKISEKERMGLPEKLQVKEPLFHG